jgi:acetyltransferase-like isoleucine patch superfamily enzyme
VAGLKGKLRSVAGASVLVFSQSLVVGLASLPTLLFWQFITLQSRGVQLLDPYGRYVIVAMSLIPAYLIFAVSLMFLSAGWNRLVGWRTEQGEYDLHDYSWKVIKWASYNASINVVRTFAGEPLRSTPLWTYYLKMNGASIGKGVYVNTARLFDHNLLVLKEKAVVGGDAKLIAHLVEAGKIKAQPVILGRKAVVGINSVVGPGVEIGDNSAVGAMSFVPKGTKIPPNEAWGGVPAKLIKRYDDEKNVQPGIPAL